MASASEWVIVSSEELAPRAAKRAAAAPWKRSEGGPPNLMTSTSRHPTPIEWPVPSAFIAASFAAKRAAKCGAGR